MAQRGHREAERTRQITNRHLLVRQRMHDADPGRVSERLKNLARVLDRVLDRQTGGRELDLPRVASTRQSSLATVTTKKLATGALIRRVKS